MPFLAIEGMIDGVARIFERGDELAVQVAVVFDDEERMAVMDPEAIGC